MYRLSPRRDSNPESQIASLLPYHLATGAHVKNCQNRVVLQDLPIQTRGTLRGGGFLEKTFAPYHFKNPHIRFSLLVMVLSHTLQLSVFAAEVFIHTQYVALFSPSGRPCQPAYRRQCFSRNPEGRLTFAFTSSHATPSLRLNPFWLC